MSSPALSDLPDASDLPVWVNGMIRPAAGALGADDRGVLLADGAFETLRVNQGTPLFRAAHEARLMHGLARLAFDTAQVTRLIEAAWSDLPALWRATASGCGAPSALRLTVLRGPAPRGLAPVSAGSPTVIMALSPLRALPSQPVRLGVFRDVAKNPSPFDGFKYLGGYGVNLLARAHAARQGWDDAILINSAGRVIGASAASLFALTTDGSIKTPPVSDGALPGTVRARMMEAMPDIEECSLDPSDLSGAAIVLANALSGPVTGVLQRSTCSIGPTGALAEGVAITTGGETDERPSLSAAQTARLAAIAHWHERSLSEEYHHAGERRRQTQS